jgi:hypothetical protein
LTPITLNSNPLVDQKKLAKVQLKFKVTMGVWAIKNYFEYYNIHATIIKMFILEFFEQPTSTTNGKSMAYTTYKLKL